MIKYDNDNTYIGNFAPNDGTIDFYLRVRSLCSQDTAVLDLGSGRGGWYHDDISTTRKSIRLLRDNVAEVISADIDPAVMDNMSGHRQMIIQDGVIPLPDASVDLIVADYVFEHVKNTDLFISEISRVLKPNGWLCARTPHKLHYVALIARILSLVNPLSLIKKLQPTRKEIDIFPTEYNLNTLNVISKTFKEWDNQSFVYRSNPSYYFGNRIFFELLSFLHLVLPTPLIGNLFVFVQKKSEQPEI